jgi:MULE transposase domain
MYTIHTKVGSTNSRIPPMVYILMSGKSEVAYTRVFQELNMYAAGLGIILAPRMILSDLEKVSINASRTVFPGVLNKVCFFHFGQCAWRKIQSAGLAERYQSNRPFACYLKSLTSLAFVPADDIPRAVDVLKPTMGVETREVVVARGELCPRQGKDSPAGWLCHSVCATIHHKCGPSMMPHSLVFPGHRTL